MYRYTTSQLAIITAVPTVTVLLLWTLAIFYKNKKQWRPYDICIVAILIQSVLRNLSILAYTILHIISQSNDVANEYCTASIWMFNSIHTFQASTLSTLSVVGLYIIKLTRKQKDIKQYLSTTHIVYHLFCLTTLCSCVGVAAILAKRDAAKSANFEFSYGKNASYNFENCQFMPYELDVKYNIFILSLHSLLAFVSIFCFMGIVITYYKYKRNGFEYLKKSTSDLSDLSLGAAASTVSQKDGMAKNFYDSYSKDTTYLAGTRPDGYPNSGKPEPWTSDTSNISTSVSSTNSRRPCLMKQKKKNQSSGMETMMPVLVICYLFNHLPLMVVCIFPWLPSPWTNGAGMALWLGLVQDALVPTALGLVDGRFNTWVSKAYRCGRTRRKSQQDKPPHGLDGKFRPFSSTAQTLEAAPMVPQVRTRPNIPPPNHQMISQNDHKFPITNGSLYTSIDGRLPIIHNYRRHKGLRSPVHSISMGLHSSFVKRQECMMNQNIPQSNHFQPQEQCDDSFISLPADYTSMGPTKQNLNDKTTNQNPHMFQQNHQNKSQSSFKQNRAFSASQNSLNDVSIIENELKKMRLISKSQDNLNDFNITQRDIQKFRHNPEVYQKQNLHLPKSHLDKDIESSDEEYFNHSISYNDEFKNYDTISSQSYCSITTEANCDFDFFAQQKNSTPNFNSFRIEPNENISPNDNNYIMKFPSNQNLNKNFPIMRSFKPLTCNNSGTNSTTNSDESNKSSSKSNVNNFRIRRSNSKQSLENLDTFIQESSQFEPQLKRTNSNRSFDSTNTFDKKTYILRSNSNRFSDIMRSNPNLTETANLLNRKPSVTHLNLKNLNSSCIHFKDKNDAYSRNVARDNISADKQRISIPVLSMESLNSMLSHKGISYLDNGDICNHNYGGSVPDFKKVFVTDFI